MSEYYIAFDENGQPYIAHGQIITNLKKGAKSVAKLVDGAKTRYFKTQEELKAYYNRSKEKVSSAAKSAGNKVKDAADTVAWNASPGYRARRRWKDAESNYKKADKAYNDANVARAKAWKDLEKNKSNRDSSAHASKGYDDAVSAIRKDNQDEVFEKTFKARGDAAEKAEEARKAYAKTTLGEVEEFMKHPVRNTVWAVEDVAYDAKMKLREIKDYFNERRTERKNARTERKMKSDPKVMKARSNYSDSEAAYNRANNAFLDYVTSPNAEKGSAKWKQLEKELDNAAITLEYAQRDLERAESRYKK